MRRLSRYALLAVLLLSSCSKTPRPVDPPAVEPEPTPRPDSAPPRPTAERPPADAVNQDKYDAALLDAVQRMTERNYAQALVALEAARAAQDTEFVRKEIDRLKAQIAQQAAVERVLQDIQTVLDDGKPEEAARLAAVALQQYGGADAAERLTRLKRQADALLATQLTDNSARRARFRAEAETELRGKNLRAAVLAYEQALQYGDDAELRKQLDAVRADLARYDDNRRRAAELRRNPATLEDALAALQEAARVWDTMQVRQEIDECTLALQQRRERLGVADFEVRGEVGLAFVGRALADELLPAFKGRFDLVERSQLVSVISELKLQASDLAENDPGRREVGRLAKLRYLVVGSITPVGGITVHARLIDVRTGLVVQTARLAARSPEELLPLAPQLAETLLMNDDQKRAHELRLAQQAQVQPAQPAPLPPVPEPVQAGQPLPPPVLFQAPPPPVPPRLRPEDFTRFPAPPPAGQPLPAPVIVAEREQPIKLRLLQVAVELGDNCFRRGRYREAFTHFEFAISLAPDNRDLRTRLDRCRPHLPPPPVVVAPPPPRPRLAVLDFVELADPRAVPPGLGVWTAEHIAPYFCPPYEVVDRGQVFWYMGRLGMTLGDVLHDPGARRWLGRALDVRFFLLGTVRPGLDVATHLLDAEYGFQVGAGAIHVHDPYELKLRLPELARLTLLPPPERERYRRDLDSSQQLVVQARRSFDRGEFAVAVAICQQALAARPNNIELLVLFQKSRDRARLAELEAARRREQERQQALAAEQLRRQQELAREAEAARLRAEQEAAARADAERLAQERRRDEACNQLLAQARLALQQDNFALSIQYYESAVRLRRSDVVLRELAQARARAEEAARTRAAQEEATREAFLRRQREAELEKARAQLEAERKRRADEEQARREAQEARDREQYTCLLDQAQRLLAQDNHDPAIALLQEARRLRPGDEVERLLNQALVEQARAVARKKDAQARAELERKLEEERKRREQAEAEARRNQDLYTQALKLAQLALAEKRYDQAIARYNEAGKIYRTDVVLAGLRQAEEAKTREQAAADAVRRKKEEDDKRAAELQRLIADGRAALKAGRHEAALLAFTEAKKLAPTNVDVLAGLSEAEQAREDARKRDDQQKRAAAMQQALAQGRKALSARDLEGAARFFAAAAQLAPKDPAVLQAQQDLQKARDAAGADAAQQKRREEGRALLDKARLALKAGRLDEAQQLAEKAAPLLGVDPGIKEVLGQVERARADLRAAEEAARKKKEAEQRTEQVRKLTADGLAHLRAGRLSEAERALGEASKLAPQDAAVLQALRDLDKARKDAAAEAERKRRQAAYQDAIRAGRAALTAKRYDDAIKSFTEAGRLLPGDRDAATGLKDAEKGRDDARAAEAARKKEEEKRRAEFARLMQQGRAALAAKRYEEAINAFRDAGKLEPGDAEPPRLLKDAQQALEASKKKPPPPQPSAYTKQMEAGAALEKQQKYAEAAKAYREALRLAPGDARAAEAAKSADFKQHLADGQKALKAKRFTEAVKEFEDALKLFPNDAEAKKLLQQAKSKKP